MQVCIGGYCRTLLLLVGKGTKGRWKKKLAKNATCLSQSDWKVWLKGCYPFSGRMSCRDCLFVSGWFWRHQCRYRQQGFESCTVWLIPLDWASCAFKTCSTGIVTQQLCRSTALCISGVWDVLRETRGGPYTGLSAVDIVFVLPVLFLPQSTWWTSCHSPHAAKKYFEETYWMRKG